MAVHLRYREPLTGALRETVALVAAQEPVANVFHFVSSAALPPNQLQSWSAGAIKSDFVFKLEFDPARPATAALRKRAAGFIPGAAPARPVKEEPATLFSWGENAAPRPALPAGDAGEKNAGEKNVKAGVA